MDIISFYIEKWYSINLSINWLAVLLLIALIVVGSLLLKKINKVCAKKSIKIDESTIGIGKNTIKLVYDTKDRELAYKMWVELKTRKLCLEFDPDEDVIVEVYDSWYKFFGISRELIKEMPIYKINSTTDLIDEMVKVLNLGIRPHLTKWQAKFRKWYEINIIKTENLDKSPQDIQKMYPQYKELVDDLKKTSAGLTSYADFLEKIAKK